MKKIWYYIALLPGILFGISCKKLVETVVPAQDITLEELIVSIPPIPFADSSFEIPAGTFTAYVNVDSTIRSNTAGLFGINSLSYIKVKQVTMQALNADGTNNLSAIKSFRIALFSNTNPTPLTVAEVDIPTGAVDSYTQIFEDNPDITPYLDGNYITYNVYCRIRKTTTITLNLSSKVIATAN